MDGSGLFERSYTHAGAAPGSLAVPEGSVEPRVRAMRFDAETLEELDVPRAADAARLLESGKVVWIDVQGLGDGEVVQQLGAAFDLHRLALSDVVNLGQRPKAEAYGDVLFVVLRMSTLADTVEWEQVSLFLRPGLVLTFQERHGDCLDPLRQRIREAGKVIRRSGSDYLACMVVDAIVDGYFPVLERDGDELERLEAEILAGPRVENVRAVYRIKRDLMAFRRATWPLREALAHLMREEGGPISASARVYLRDTTDHVMQVVDVNETYRELASSLIDLYLSSVGHKTNEIMRVLTLVATIFIPLTFVAGIYGMNFDTSLPGNLPELGWRYGYLFFWLVCIALGGSLLALFRRLGWLGPRERAREPDSG